MASHDIDSDSDLFQAQEELPDNIRAIIDHHTALIEENDGDAYILCGDFQTALEAEGYTFDFGLDGVPFDLQKMNLPIYLPIHKEGDEERAVYDICHEVDGEWSKVARGVSEDQIGQEIAKHAHGLGATAYQIVGQMGRVTTHRVGSK